MTLIFLHSASDSSACIRPFTPRFIKHLLCAGHQHSPWPKRSLAASGSQESKHSTRNKASSLALSVHPDLPSPHPTPLTSSFSPPPTSFSHTCRGHTGSPIPGIGQLCPPPHPGQGFALTVVSFSSFCQISAWLTLSCASVIRLTAPL